MLVWHNQLPTWLTEGVANGTISKTELRDLLQKHITTVVKRGTRARSGSGTSSTRPPATRGTPPRRSTWKGFWAQNLGPTYIADAFRWARAADPSALLFYNDYNMEAFGDRGPGTRSGSSTT